MKIDINVETEEYWDREPDPDDQWDAGRAGLRIRGVSVCRIPDDRGYGFDIDAQPGDRVTVLVEHYSDGSTFGSKEYAEIKGVYRSEALAASSARNINTGHGYFGSHIDFLYFDVILPGR